MTYSFLVSATSIFSVLMFAILKGKNTGIFNPIFMSSLLLMLGVCLRSVLLCFLDLNTSLIAPWVLENNFSLDFSWALMDLTAAILFLFIGCILYFSAKVNLSRHNVKNTLKIKRIKVLLKKTESFSAPKVEYNLLAIVTLIGIIAISFFWVDLIRKNGSISLVINLFQSRSQEALSGSSYLLIFSSLSRIVSLFIYYNLIQSSKKNISHMFVAKIKYFPMTLMIFFMFISLILTGGRANLIFFVISLSIIFYSVKKEKIYINLSSSFKLFLLFLVMINFLNFGYASRKSAQLGIPLQESYSQASQEFLSNSTKTFPIIDDYVLSKKYVLDNGHDYGYQYLSYFSRLIPREVWPDKPEVLGLKFREHFFKDKLGGIPPGFFGELYVASGLIGLLIGSFLLGMFIGQLIELYELTFISPGRSILYVILLQNFALEIFYSGLEIVLFKAIIDIFNLYLILFLCRRIGWVITENKLQWQS